MNELGGLTRRRALGLFAGTSVASVAAACSSPPRGSGHHGSARGPVPSTTRTHRASAHAADWRTLDHHLAGRLQRRGDSGYDAARLLFDRRFDAAMPSAVAPVSSAAEIATCLDFARHFRLPISIRSGGHSYVGASTGSGLVIDLRPMSAITVGSGTATIGAGAALIDVYNSVASRGVSIPAGSCPSVGISGLTLGGGVGVIARRYGLTCDQLVEAKVVTADGSLTTCSANKNADLFWALHGGGGSFGIVTSLTLTTHAAPSLAHAYVAWPWSAAAEVVAAWQSWAVAAPKSLWSSCHVLANTTGGLPTIAVPAVMVGTTAALQEHIGQLIQAIPTGPTTNSVTSESYAATMMLEAGCSTKTLEECRIADETPGGTLPRDAFVAGSDFFRHPIPTAGISALIKAVERRQSDPRLGTGGASFDILGGAIDDVADDATAWSHRGALFNAQYTASWGDQPGNGALARNQHSLAKIHNSVRSYASGEAYQNYADDSLANPQQAYYGANLARLVETRRTYDPDGIFTQPQGIPLS